MKTETTIEATDALALAKSAINHVLQRVQRDENIRYHMALTESFERLKAAQAALNGLSEEAIEEEVFSIELKRKPAAVKIREILDLLDSVDCRPGNHGRIITDIAALCRA